MPGHDSFDGGITLGDILQRLIGPQLADVARGVAQATLPDCACCARKAVPVRCFRCGDFVCQEHGYFSISKRDALCHPCKRELLKSAGEIDEGLSPFEVLELEEDATAKEVERAFRIKARQCHPDLHPDDTDKEREFRRLQWAREAALQQQG